MLRIDLHAICIERPFGSPNSRKDKGEKNLCSASKPLIPGTIWDGVTSKTAEPTSQQSLTARVSGHAALTSMPERISAVYYEADKEFGNRKVGKNLLCVSVQGHGLSRYDTEQRHTGLIWSQVPGGPANRANDQLAKIRIDVRL